MFQGFAPEASDFFWELCFNNDRTWFYNHKEQFDSLISDPLKELSKSVTDLLTSRYPEKEFVSRVSRIWRDARRLFGRGPLKESMWFSIRGAERESGAPSFYFEVKPAVFSYGMGFWSETAEQSERFRKAIDANPARFLRLAEETEKLERFQLEGPEYKKAKGNYEEPIKQWYNRKCVSLCHDENFGGDILSPDLPRILADAYAELMPMYEFLDEAIGTGRK